MGLIRKPDWQACLAQYTSDQSRRPFVYGASDCALFAAGAVEAMTGTDTASDWRGRYTTLKGGLRVLRQSGHNDHIAAAASFMPDANRPRVGDIAVVATEDGSSLGVIQGAWVYVRTMGGIGLVPVSEITRVLRCG
ncbi:MAG: hypothetical protein JKX71_12875 [Amylibacter sp.]|nr:hypothetical protein [Amylibacter sp.]